MSAEDCAAVPAFVRAFVILFLSLYDIAAA